MSHDFARWNGGLQTSEEREPLEQLAVFPRPRLVSRPLNHFHDAEPISIWQMPPPEMSHWPQTDRDRRRLVEGRRLLVRATRRLRWIFRLRVIIRILWPIAARWVGR